MVSRDREGQAGAAAVDFVLVGSLVVVLFLGVLQLGLAQHVRSSLINAAAEGARFGGRADRGPADAVDRTRELIRQAVSDRYAKDVEATVSSRSGLEIIEVTVQAPLPVIGLIGPQGKVSVTAHALMEPA